MSAVDRVALRRSAEAHAERRDFPSAIEAFEGLLRVQPGDADVLLQLSYMHSLAGHYRSARRYALEAAEQRPRDGSIVKELVARLRTFNEAEALLGTVRRLVPLDRVEIPVLIAVAAQLSYLNLQGDALRLLDEARRGDPEYPPTLLSRAQVLIYLGRFDEAQAELMRCMRRAPGLPQLFSLLATLGRTPENVQLPRLIVERMQRPGLSSQEAALLGFALHQELDRAGRYEQAWQALEYGCRAKRSMLDYRASDTAALFATLKQLTGVDARGDAPTGTPRPIFIVGMHRSGTTLLEQLLDAHPEVKGIGELYDFTSAMRFATDHHCRGVIDTTLVARAPSVDYDDVGRRYLDGVAWRLEGAPVFTDKLPSNFVNLGFIARALPNARILHMVRDPVETCFSNLRELFSDANPYSYDMGELAAYHREYRGLMAHWKQVLPGRILDVDYARLTREPEGVMRDVASFCGLDFVDAMTDTRSSTRAVATASAVQVRQGIRGGGAPKWAPYERYLQPLIDGLAQVD